MQTYLHEAVLDLLREQCRDAAAIERARSPCRTLEEARLDAALNMTMRATWERALVTNDLEIAQVMVDPFLADLGVEEVDPDDPCYRRLLRDALFVLADLQREFAEAEIDPLGRGGVMMPGPKTLVDDALAAKRSREKSAPSSDGDTASNSGDRTVDGHQADDNGDEISEVGRRRLMLALIKHGKDVEEGAIEVSPDHSSGGETDHATTAEAEVVAASRPQSPETPRGDDGSASPLGLVSTSCDAMAAAGDERDVDATADSWSWLLESIDMVSERQMRVPKDRSSAKASAAADAAASGADTPRVDAPAASEFAPASTILGGADVTRDDDEVDATTAGWLRLIERVDIDTGTALDTASGTASPSLPDSATPPVSAIAALCSPSHPACSPTDDRPASQPTATSTRGGETVTARRMSEFDATANAWLRLIAGTEAVGAQATAFDEGQSSPPVPDADNGWSPAAAPSPTDDRSATASAAFSTLVRETGAERDDTDVDGTGGGWLRLIADTEALAACGTPLSSTSAPNTATHAVAAACSPDGRASRCHDDGPASACPPVWSLIEDTSGDDDEDQGEAWLQLIGDEDGAAVRRAPFDTATSAASTPDTDAAAVSTIVVADPPVGHASARAPTSNVIGESFATPDESDDDATGDAWMWLIMGTPMVTERMIRKPSRTPPAVTPRPGLDIELAASDLVRMTEGTDPTEGQVLKAREIVRAVTVSEAFSAYADMLAPDRHRKAPISPARRNICARAREIETALELWCDLVGDMPLAAVTSHETRMFRDELGKVPARHGRAPYLKQSGKRWVKMSAKEAQDFADERDFQKISHHLRMFAQKSYATGDEADQGEHDAFEPRLSRRTINRHLDNLNRLFRSLKDVGVLPTNAFCAMRFKARQISSSARFDRAALDDLDMRILFGSPLMVGRGSYIDGKGRQRNEVEAFWLWLLSGTTGMRPEEAAQLEVDDFVVKDGITVMTVRNDGRRRLKNNQSKRDVPVPALLEKLGLLDMVEERRREGDRRIFPKLTYRRCRQLKDDALPINQYSSLCCQTLQRMNNYLRSLGVSEGKTVYSIRHTFITRLGNKGVPINVIDELVGHAPSGQTCERYLKGVSNKILKDAVDSLDHGVILERDGDRWRIAPLPEPESESGTEPEDQSP